MVKPCLNRVDLLVHFLLQALLLKLEVSAYSQPGELLDKFEKRWTNSTKLTI